MPANKYRFPTHMTRTWPMLYLNSDLSAFSPIHFNSTLLVRFQILSQAPHPPIVCLSLFRFKKKPNQTKQTQPNKAHRSLSISLSLRETFSSISTLQFYITRSLLTLPFPTGTLRNSQIQVSLAHLQAIESLNPDFVAFLRVLRFKSCSSHWSLISIAEWCFLFGKWMSFLLD